MFTSTIFLATVNTSNLLEINIFVLIAHIIAGIAIFTILFLLVHKPLAKWMKKRFQYFEKQKNETQKNLQLSEATQKAASAKLAKTESFTEELVKDAKIQAEEIRKKLIFQAQKESQDLIKSGETESMQIKKQAKRDIQKSIAENSILLAEKILQEKMNSKIHQKMIDEFINSLNEK